jgi:hypothetical protein
LQLTLQAEIKHSLLEKAKPALVSVDSHCKFFKATGMAGRFKKVVYTLLVDFVTNHSVNVLI